MTRILMVLILMIATPWFAVNIYLGAGAAPAVFAHAQPNPDALFTRSVAGALFGDVLGSWQHAIDYSLWPALGAVLCLLGVVALRQRRWWLAALGLLTIVCLSGVHIWSTSVVAQARHLRPPTTTVEQILAQSSNSSAVSSLGGQAVQAPTPYSESQRAQFDTLHQRSVTLFGTESLILLALCLASAVAVILDRDPLSASAQRPGR